ncbi:MAG: TIGR02266 family protein [Deltaproteobacteria bacterium]|nr:TIGR02266 family protein [Deltaproteobacteria bacterium]
MTTPDVPLVRLQLRYPDEGTFIQRFSPNVTRGGIFLASRTPFPVGTVLNFEVSLVQGPPLLGGTGKVAWVREYNPDEPQRAHGMGVQFLNVAPGSRPMLERLLARKAMPARRTPIGGVPAAAADPSGGHVLHPSSAPASGPHGVGFLQGDPSTWIDDHGVRAAADRARVLASRVEDVEALRAREREEAPTIEEALANLPHLLGPRHRTG